MTQLDSNFHYYKHEKTLHFEKIKSYELTLRILWIIALELDIIDVVDYVLFVKLLRQDFRGFALIVTRHDHVGSAGGHRDQKLETGQVALHGR